MEKTNGNTALFDKTAHSFSEQITNLNPILLDTCFAEGEFYFSSPEEGFSALLQKYAQSVQLVFLEAAALTGPVTCTRKIGFKGYLSNSAYIHQTLCIAKATLQEAQPLLRNALTAAHELLCTEGVVCVSATTANSTQVRLLLDEVFGEKNFINEIIWHYRSKGTSKRYFSKKHELLYFYSKTKNYSFYQTAVGDLRSRIGGTHLKRNQDPAGKVYYSTISNGKEYRYYEDEVVPFDDVWDIPALQSNSADYIGLSTQKPEELFKRILLPFTREGDRVAELFAGSGSMLLEAARYNRSFIGFDSSSFSLQAVRSGILAQPGASLKIIRTFPYDNSAIVNLNVLYRGGDILLLLDGYSHCILQDLPHYDDTREYLDYWAAGYLEGDTFVVTDYSQRSRLTPKLRETLRIPNKSKGAVYFMDVMGNEKFIMI